MKQVYGIVISANVYEEEISGSMQNTSSGLSTRTVSSRVKYTVVYHVQINGKDQVNSYSVFTKSDNWFMNLFNSRPSKDKMTNWLNNFPVGSKIPIVYSDDESTKNWPAFSK